MVRQIRLAAVGAALAILLVSACAHGEDSVYDVLTQTETNELKLYSPDDEELILEEAAIEPAIDIAGDAFVSKFPQTSWSAGVELVAFHPDFSTVDFNQNGKDTFSITPRFFLGWEGGSGFGVRGRLWGSEATGTTDTYRRTSTVEFSTLRGFNFRGIDIADQLDFNAIVLRAAALDLDVYKRFGSGRTSAVLGAGFTSAALQFEHVGYTEDTISGAGIGFFTDLRHTLYHTDRTELALVGSGRVGFLTGEWRDEATSTIREKDADMVVSEASFGMEWKRDLGWSVLVLRGQYETQLWSTDITEDVAFAGGVLRAGLSW